MLNQTTLCITVIAAVSFMSGTVTASDVAVPEVEAPTTVTAEAATVTSVPGPAPVNLLVSKEIVAPAAPAVRTLTGSVGAVDNSGLSLIFGVNQEDGMNLEAWLTFSPELQLKGYKSRKHISEDDIVEVMIDENTLILRGIILKKKALPKKEEVTVEDEFVSGEEPDEEQA